MTKTTRLARVIPAFFTASAIRKNVMAKTKPTVGKWLRIMWTCDHVSGVVPGAI